MATPLPPEWDSWVQEGARLLAAPPLRRSEQITRGPEDPKFALGDFLLTVPPEYVVPLAEALHLPDPTRFEEYREVAKALPLHRRVAASWSTHRNLRHRPELLRDGLTVRQGDLLLGGKPYDAKPDHKLSVEERAGKVRDGLADPEVFALIDRELAESRAERKLRGKARRIVSEHAAREKELEAELRELRSARSAFEATVKVELDVNRATQLVHAIGQTLGDLPQAERIVAALTDLSLETATVLVANQPAEDDPHAPIVIEGEVWQARPARAALTDSNQGDLSGEGRTVIEIIDDGPSRSPET